MADIVRSVELNRRSGIIRVRAGDGTTGTVYFRDGRAVDGELGTATGREAIQQLLAFRQGTFVVAWGPVDRPDVVGMAPRALVLDGLRRLAGPAAIGQAADAREPGVERRGTVLSGTIQDNRGTGSTAVGWAPALATSAEPAAAAGRAGRSRNVRVAVLGAALGCALVALLFLGPGARGWADPAAPLPPLIPPRPVITPVAVAPPVLPPGEATAPEEAATSPVEDCRDVYALGNPAATVEVCTRAFMVLPDSARIAAILAHAELDQGHFELAGEWARKAVDIDPTLAEPYAYLGFVADQAGRRHEARASYRRYLELAPRGAYAEDITTILGR